MMMAQATTHVPALERTLHLTHEWLRDIAEAGSMRDEQQAWSALRAVLHTLRDRLTVEESADLAAQLPQIIRGAYFEGWKPSHQPTRQRTLEQFLDSVRAALPTNDVIDADIAVRATFQVLNDRVTAGEIQDVKGMLPEVIRKLWPV